MVPIRPEERGRYPKGWPAISRRIRKERAGGRCESEGCGAVNGRPHPITGSRVVLTVAHLDHTPENCAEANLKALCQLHHNRYDAANRRAGIRRRARLRHAIGDLFEGAGDTARRGDASSHRQGWRWRPGRRAVTVPQPRRDPPRLMGAASAEGAEPVTRRGGA